MKKMVFVLMSVLLVALTACEGPMGPEGPPGRDGIVNKREVIFTVEPNDWKAQGQSGIVGAFFQARKDFPELSQNIFYNKSALVYGYLVRNIDDPAEYQTLLPFDLYDRDINTGEFYTETYDFDYRPGYIYFNMSPSDFKLFTPQEDLVFRVLVIW